MGKSSAASAAAAACDHVHNIWFGTMEDEYVSMAVISDGNPYGVPDGIMYSFPCRITRDRQWEIVPNLQINEFSQQKMTETG